LLFGWLKSGHRPTFLFFGLFFTIFACFENSAAMSHPLIPQILQIAETVATPLGLEVLEVYIYTHKNPAVIRIDIRNISEHTGLDDCERMSRALEAELDLQELIPHAYELEISSPGTARILANDREFMAFRGFKVNVSSHVPHDGKQEWQGQLVNRSEDTLVLSLKGKLLNIPLAVISKVELI
jgi:ribosome maturation factor RimP